MIIEESLENKKAKNGKGNRRRRLRKKYQLSDSSDEGCSQRKSTANRNSAIPGLTSEDEDSVPISSCLKAKKGIQDGEENADTRIDEGGLPMRYGSHLFDNSDNLTYDTSLVCTSYVNYHLRTLKLFLTKATSFNFQVSLCHL